MKCMGSRCSYRSMTFPFLPVSRNISWSGRSSPISSWPSGLISVYVVDETRKILRSPSRLELGVSWVRQNNKSCHRQSWWHDEIQRPDSRIRGKHAPTSQLGWVFYGIYRTLPEIFRQWGGISCVAGASERKVWIRSMKMDLYPNLYTILVAPPGISKSVALYCWKCSGELETITWHRNPCPRPLWWMSNDAKRTKTIIGPDPVHMEFNSLRS